ncbi:MAG: diguanylate cyclase (GGDEF)-like protein [Pseudorhodobacter sp.]|jgi:diguanylate cyclase (GGDEF)-like protein
MEKSGKDVSVSIETTAMGRLMPMHLWLSDVGEIQSVGPTLAKVFGGDPIVGKAFFDVFEVRRPGGVLAIDDLRRRAGNRLSVAAYHMGAQPLRGIAQPLPGNDGILINLSFGIGVIDAVSAFELTDADFAVTDLAMELLYLVEAKTAITQELRQLNLRLQGARDIAELQALTDMLTGLRNRRGLDLSLEAAINQGQEFGLMHIDLDFFKAVNDSLGHAAGDHVLREVARSLLEETRKTDTVARVGGDEFVLLFSTLTDSRALTRIATRIVKRLSEPMEYDGKSCRISASIGITVSTDYKVPVPEQMLSDADQALYASKNAGRGQARLFEVVQKTAPEANC